MRLLRSWFVLLLLLAGASSMPASAPAPRSAADALPEPAAYVDDYAMELTPTAAAQLERLCREVHTKTRAQIFFVTVRTTGDDGIDQFANDLYHRWKIGEKKTDRGVLVLLATADHTWRIEVGYGLEPVIGDAQAGEIGRAMVPALKTADYDQAARTGVEGVAKLIAADAHVALDALDAPLPPAAAVLPAEAAPAAGQDLFGLFFILLMLFGLAFIVALTVLFGRGPNAPRGYAGPAILPNPYPNNGNDWTIAQSNTSPADDNNWVAAASDPTPPPDTSSFSGGDGGDSGGGGASGSW